jgi:hypothetical protein
MLEDLLAEIERAREFQRGIRHFCGEKLTKLVGSVVGSRRTCWIPEWRLSGNAGIPPAKER